MSEPTTGDLPVLDDEAQERVEEWYVHRGLPHLISDYNAREDIFTRATPFLSFVFLAEVLFALNSRFEWWGNVLSVLGAVILAVGGLAVVNAVRGRRLLRPPDTIGGAELALFVLVPPLMPLLAGQPRQVLVLVGLNLGVLGVTYVATSYGLVPMALWAAAQLRRQLRDLLGLFFRSLPVMLLFSMFLFLNAEVWKVMDDIPPSLYAGALGLLVVIGALFIALRSTRALDELEHFGSWREVCGLAATTERAPLGSIDCQAVVSRLTDPPQALPLSTSARRNARIVFFVSQATQVLLVTVVIFAFYVAFGLLVITDTTIDQWTSSASVEGFATWQVGDVRVGVTGELLRTAAFIATIVGLQFLVSALTDSSYRDEFSDHIDRELREAFAVRALERALMSP